MASEPNFSINDGIHGELPDISPMQIGVISAFMALSLWIVFEFHVRVFRFFARRRGLYFWSLMVLSWGVVLHSVGYLLNWFEPDCPWQVYTLMNAIGWSMIVTAESLVLYSRMHLVTRNVIVHRSVLGMIIATALLIQVPNWCISIPSNSRDDAVSAVWSPPDSIFTRIQQVAFLLQEGTISVLYIVYAHRLLKPNAHVRERRIVWDLIFVSGFVVFLDVVVIILAFTNEHIVKEPLQNFSYALKLQLEFFVLNQLLEVSGDGFGPSASGGPGALRSRYHAPTASDASKAPVLEKGAGAGLGSAPRMPSDDSGLSSVDKELPPRAAAMAASPSTDRTVVPPTAVHMRNASVQSYMSPAAMQSPVSPLAPSPVGKDGEFFIPRGTEGGHLRALESGTAERQTAGHPDFVAPLRVSSRNGSRMERALPPEPPLMDQPPSRSWLDLETRVTDMERKLNALV